ncbi:sensor histidine kinase MtrB [mine drainage metagenome]|uniref:Sensor histidine kinase MtrB n=1 Tax=mine drainage metagenome TaxID=410659 RepID=A0A1J5QVV0_9ZZZZ
MRWRASLQLRVITSTLAIGLIVLVALGAFLSARIRNGIFDQRVTQILGESARSTQQAQNTFDSSTAGTESDVQELLNDMARALQSGGSGDREVFLLPSPGNHAPIVLNTVVSASDLVPLISPELRAATVAGKGQRWQSVAEPVRVASGFTDSQPAVIVGSKVNVPVAGTYELYFLYNLESEQQSLEFLQRVLLLGGAALVLLLGGMTFLVTRQAVRPVRVAARVAERLADGHLTERMKVRGQDEMATLARSFNEMAGSLQIQIARLEELSTLQRRFVSDVSHELRTPLTTIRMAGEVLHAARDDFEPAAKRSAELLATQLDRFEDLLADLLEISRFDAGAAMLDAEDRDMCDVVLAAVEHAMPLAERRSTWLRVTLPEAGCRADIDPRRAERILRNLLVNAIEHAEGSTVEIEAASDGRAVAVTVRDHGVGMTPEEATHVFDRFWRADPARARTTGGTGLGLAISLEDARLHGGWLEAWGLPGHGASFRLTVPRRAGIALASSPLPLEPPPAPPAPIPRWTASPQSAVDPAALPDMDQLEMR